MPQDCRWSQAGVATILHRLMHDSTVKKLAVQTKRAEEDTHLRLAHLHKTQKLLTVNVNGVT